MNRALFLLLLASCAEPARAAPRATGPVLVELFTSQGCSSCPPAEALLGELKSDPRIIPLAFHVTYWDDLGWKDPFSDESYTARQQAYSRRLGGGLYTPEAVIGGVAHTVGTRRDQILSHVGGAAEPSSGPCLAAAIEAEAVVITPSCTPPSGVDFWAAIVEDGLVTEVGRGENKGRSLTQDAVVRRLVRANDKVSIPRDHSWKRIGVVGFAQERSGLKIVAAARLLPTSP